MHLSSLHSRLVGRWSGESTLFTSWLPTKEHKSNSTMVVGTVAKGKFLTFGYMWTHEGKEHEGLLLVGNENKTEAATGSWVDSWHMSGSIFQCKGTVDNEGVVRLLGSYEAPPGPDWDWRIEVHSPSPDELNFRMFNISPDGVEEPAVETAYRRMV